MATGQYTQFPIDWKTIDASQVPYTNTASGLSATDVQGAIDELSGSESFTVSLPLSAWSANAQTVSDAKFVASGYSYFVSASPSDTLDYGESVIYADNVTTDGSMTFRCVDLPVRDLAVNIVKVAVTA